MGGRRSNGGGDGWGGGVGCDGEQETDQSRASAEIGQVDLAGSCTCAFRKTDVPLGVLASVILSVSRSYLPTFQ